jgi:hypothetical protein
VLHQDQADEDGDDCAAQHQTKTSVDRHGLHTGGDGRLEGRMHSGVSETGEGTGVDDAGMQQALCRGVGTSITRISRPRKGNWAHLSTALGTIGRDVQRKAGGSGRCIVAMAALNPSRVQRRHCTGETNPAGFSASTDPWALRSRSSAVVPTDTDRKSNPP